MTVSGTDVAMRTLTALFRPQHSWCSGGGWRIDDLAKQIRLHPAEMERVLAGLMANRLVVARYVDGLDESNVLSWRWYLTARGLAAVRRPQEKA